MWKVGSGRHLLTPLPAAPRAPLAPRANSFLLQITIKNNDFETLTPGDPQGSPGDPPGIPWGSPGIPMEPQGIPGDPQVKVKVQVQEGVALRQESTIFSGFQTVLGITRLIRKIPWTTQDSLMIDFRSAPF